MKITYLFSLLLFSTLPLSAEIESQIPLGIQAATGYRTDYVYRGLTLSESTLDFQVEGEIALSENSQLGYSTWFATATGDQDFTESGFKLSHTQEFNDFQLTHSLAYRNLSNSTFRSGLEIDSSLSYDFLSTAQLSHSIAATLSYDTGASGWYAAVQYQNYTKLSRNSYLSFHAGISATQNYYQLDGANDIFSRLSYTYNISKQVSFTPFIGTSISLDHQQSSDQLYGGAWFEVSF